MKNEIIIESMFDLSHYKLDERLKPSYFNIKEICDEFGLSIKEAMNIAEENGYKVYKFNLDESLIIISSPELTREQVLEDINKYASIFNIDEKSEGSFNESLNEELIFGIYLNDEEKPMETGSREEMLAKKKHLDEVSPKDSYGNRNRFTVKQIGETSWESLDKCEEGLDDIQFVKSAKHLLKVVDKNGKFIEEKIFRTRPEMDKYIDSKWGSRFFDLTGSKDIADYKNKKFVGDAWNLIITPEENESIDTKHGDVENAPFVVSVDGEKFAFDTKHNMEHWIDTNQHSFDKIEIIKSLEEAKKEKKEYYYNYDIICDEYLRGGVIHSDLEGYASSEEELIEIVNEEEIYDYLDEEDADEYKEDYGDFGVKINYTDDPRSSAYSKDIEDEDENHKDNSVVYKIVGKKGTPVEGLTYAINYGSKTFAQNILDNANTTNNRVNMIFHPNSAFMWSDEDFFDFKNEEYADPKYFEVIAVDSRTKEPIAESIHNDYETLQFQLEQELKNAKNRGASPKELRDIQREYREKMNSLNEATSENLEEVKNVDDLKRILNKEFGSISATFKPGGLHLCSKEELNNNYVVSYDNGIVKYKPTQAQEIFDKLQEYIKRDSDRYTGIWEDNGEVYVDQNMLKSDLASALDIAVDNHQKAIYGHNYEYNLEEESPKLIKKNPDLKKKVEFTQEELDDIKNSKYFKVDDGAITKKVESLEESQASDKKKLKYLLQKEECCPLDRDELWELQELINKYGYPEDLEEDIEKHNNDYLDLETKIDNVDEKNTNMFISLKNEVKDAFTNKKIEADQFYKLNMMLDYKFNKDWARKNYEPLNLEEDIEKHDELNPKLFDGEELKQEVKEAIEKIADTFVKELNDDGIRFTLKDIVLLGSNVSYNYTKDSDLDIHLIADSSGLECPDNLYPLLYSAYRSIFNRNYDITIKGIPAEIYVEMDEPQAMSNGIYSLNNGWLKHPEQKAIPELDREAFEKLFKEWEDKYFDLLDRINEDLSDDIYDFIEDLYDLRKESISKEGEYGLGNLVFKEMRNLGYLDNLKELRKQEKGKELSLESVDTSSKDVIIKENSEDSTMTDEIVYGYKVPSDMVGYYKVEFFDDDGRCLNHWLSGNQIQYFKNRDDAVKYIDEVRSWNVFRFTQTLISKIR